ncbi:hypothetical protein BU26DRAFT_574746 [Trematosphaeria pertusa]|uniref:Uncharacterized protein n=1 Tax=Trematosphaeria pertusa TaxID=390896 RepID=A0A6A6J1U0_9PLEO|nr:uncharacterized protein BU26DRAFT_574746 [Trematosphaeria pertusa]KAF2256528.1 hypothetical protein BU26DRAFT_574746 [Trematosphaeria pertusa]
MPTFETLKDFWEKISANWTPFSLGTQPYLVPLHEDRVPHSHHRISEGEPLLPDRHRAPLQEIPEDSFLEVEGSEDSGRDSLSNVAGLSVNAANALAVNSANETTYLPSRTTISADSIIAQHHHPAPRNLMGNSSTKYGSSAKYAARSTPAPLLFQHASKLTNKRPLKVDLHGHVGGKPAGKASADTGLSAATAYGIIWKQPRPHLAQAMKRRYAHTEGYRTSQAQHRHSPLQSNRPAPPSRTITAIRHTNTDTASAASLQSSPTPSLCETDTSTPTPTTRAARAALARIMTRQLSHERALGISYTAPPPLGISPAPEPNDAFATLSELEAARAHDFSEHHRLILHHAPPMPEPDSAPPSSSSYASDSSNSEDGPVVFRGRPRHRQRRWDLGPGYRDRRWWEFDFDEWNAWIGVWLVGVFVGIVLVAAGVAVWILMN